MLRVGVSRKPSQARLSTTARKWPYCGAGARLVQHRSRLAFGRFGLGDGFRCVTTSLLGYGETDERRTMADASIDHECHVVEQVIERAGGRVHLVGHSFGGLVALAVALRGRAQLASLTILEAPAVGLLGGEGDESNYRDFMHLTDSYFRSYRNGNREAIAAMIDFYGGPGHSTHGRSAFSRMPSRRPRSKCSTGPAPTHSRLSNAALSALAVPTEIIVGAMSRRAVQRANELVMHNIPGAELWEIEGAAHFMIATHPEQIAKIISARVADADRRAAMNGKPKISRR